MSVQVSGSVALYAAAMTGWPQRTRLPVIRAPLEGEHGSLGRSTGRAEGPVANALTSVRGRPRRILAGAAVDDLAQDVRVPGVPAIFFDQVHQNAPDVRVAPVWQGLGRRGVQTAACRDRGDRARERATEVSQSS